MMQSALALRLGSNQKVSARPRFSIVVRGFAVASLAAFLMLACSTQSGRRPLTDGSTADAGADGSSMCPASGISIRCSGRSKYVCTDGVASAPEVCPQSCLAGIGCAVCAPNSTSCDAQGNVQTCKADGSGYESSGACSATPGNACVDGACINLCDKAAADRSYIGCEYYAVTTVNQSVLPEFSFALVIANPQSVPASVTITRGTTTVSSTTIAANGIATVKVPWVNELKNALRSAILENGAYRVQSSVPVTVHQFSPLEYRIARDCAGEAGRRQPPNDGQCFSFTNDASLLLPVAVMTGNYLAASRQTYAVDGSPGSGFVTVVGVSETPVTVEFQNRGQTIGSVNGAIPARAAGGSFSFTLRRGEVAQILSGSVEDCANSSSDRSASYCDYGAAADLTGSVIRADGPVAVFGGHDCSFVPYNRFACDHLEEQMVPAETLGNSVVVARSEPLRTGEPDVVRVISSADNNTITLDPAVVPPFTLQRGEYKEFEARVDLVATATAPIYVQQFLVGQNYGGNGMTVTPPVGDPSMSSVVPSEQYRTRYDFLAPDTYDQTFITVVAPFGSSVTLDGASAPIDGFQPIGSSNFVATRVQIQPGIHRLDSSQAFGVSIYGVGSYTSYMLPAGMDLQLISAPL